MRRFITRFCQRGGSKELVDAVRAFANTRECVERIPVSIATGDGARIKSLVEDAEHSDEHCHFRLHVESIVKLSNPDLEARCNEYCTREGAGNPTSLFHGTKPSSLEAIATDGFQLRAKTWYSALLDSKQMFGDGVYFTKHAHKAARYCGNETFTASSKNKERRIEMLLCRVFLGNQLTLTKANHDLNLAALQARQTESNFLSYHSVHGQESQEKGGLHHSEDVIYHARQAYPEYVVTCRQTLKSDSELAAIREALDLNEADFVETMACQRRVI